MQRSLRATSPKLVLVACIAAVFALAGCSQFVDFDRSQIPDQNGKDGGRPSDGGTGGMDAGKDAGPTRPDASMDATMSLPDGNMSMEGGAEGGTGCNPANHDGCADDQLCCAAATGGTFACVTTSPTQCESCGTACDMDVADVCTGRTCGCGAGSTTECEGGTPLCDLDESLCVECRDTNDCTGNPNGEFCFEPGATATAQDNTCVECDPTSGSGCGGTTPICSAAGECVACASSGANACPGTQACLPSGACECSTSADCTTPTAPICDSVDKQCRGCKSVGNECTTVLSKDYCVDEQRCSDCVPTTEAGCSGTTPDCRLNASSEYECLACTTNSHCANLGATDVCNTGNGRCVECVEDNDCSGATPLCNANVCVACDNAAISAGTRDTRCDAKSAANTVACATSGSKKGECTACDPADHGGCASDRLCCEGTGGVPSCEATGFGTQCAACDTACSGLNVNACNGHTCGCGAGAACSGTTDICNGGTCVDCTASGGCTGDTLCKTTTNVCVECLLNADCREVGDDPTQTFCAANNTCVSCIDSDDCTNAATPICNGSGVCVACTNGGVSATACNSKTPGTVCITGGSGAPAGACGACSPPTDNGCNASSQLDQCKTGAVPACVDCDASGGCAGDTLCKTTTNACVECLVNADCREVGDDPAQTFCDTDSNTCVACLASADCTGDATKPICDTSSFTCKECDAPGIAATACNAKTAGTICVATSGRCGLCDPDDSSECTAPGLPICNASSLTCAACTGETAPDAACADKSAGAPQCVTGGLGSTAGSCGVCDPTDDSGCSPAGLDQCKPGATPVCVDCVAQSDCTGNLACVSNACQACATNPDCSGHPTGTVCVDVDATAATDFECRQCDPANGNADCGGGTPTCDGGSFTCVP